MPTAVQKWGNSLGVRIPRHLANELQIEAGTPVDMHVINGSLTITPAPRPRHRQGRVRLKDILASLTPEKVTPTVRWGADVGTEIIR